jgi:hypothetical protein
MNSLPLSDWTMTSRAVRECRPYGTGSQRAGPPGFSHHAFSAKFLDVVGCAAAAVLGFRLDASQPHLQSQIQGNHAKCPQSRGQPLDPGWRDHARSARNALPPEEAYRKCSLRNCQPRLGPPDPSWRPRATTLLRRRLQRDSQIPCSTSVVAYS